MNSLKKISAGEIFLLISLGFLCWLVFFKGLGEYSLRVWDEGRNAVNALEMSQNNNFLVTFFGGKPDMWNTKPPLLIWLINLCFGIFGKNELSVRLPSAISATGIVFLIYFWVKKRLGTKIGAWLSSLILLSSMGFSDWHIGRTGDYDALLTLLIFGFAILFFEYLENSKDKKKIYLSFLLLVGAVLTKGIAGLFIIGGIFVYLCLTRKVVVLLQDKHFWRSVVMFLGIVLLYYFLREKLNNGYLKAVWDNEILRSVSLRDTIKSSFNFYWKYLNEYRFSKWILIVPVSFLAIFLTKDRVKKRWIGFNYFIYIVYFGLISSMSTKYLWYDAQLYPFMSILVGLFIFLAIKRIHWFFRLLPIFILVFYLQRFIRTNIAYIARPDLEKDNTCIKYGYVFRKEKINNELIGVHDDFCTPLDFYLLRNGNKRKEINDLLVGDKIFSCDGRTLNLVSEKYEIKKILDTPEQCVEEIITKIKKVDN